MSVQFRVRPAVPADTPALFRLKQALTAAEGNEAILRATEADWRRDGFGPEPRFRAFVAERDDAVFGMVTYNEMYSTALAGALYSIQDLFVAPERRKLGAGRALMAQVAAAAIAQGVPLIQLNVLADNPARGFYRSLGFQHLRPCLTYAIGGEPMVELSLAGGEQLRNG